MSAIITIRGRLGADPATRQTSNGNQTATGSLAVTLPSRREDETEWFNLIAFGRVAEVLGGHKKGDSLVVMGELQVNKYTDAEPFDDDEQRRNNKIFICTDPGGSGGAFGNAPLGLRASPLIHNFWTLYTSICDEYR